MALVLGLLACVGLWWLSKDGARLGTLAAKLPAHRIAAWIGLGLAAVLLLRGNLAAAALLGLGSLWMLEGPRGIGRRVARLLPSGARVRSPSERRTGLIAARLHPDGSVAEARVIAGPWAGARLDDLPHATMLDLLALARARDPEGATLLEAYLDRRSPGWRVDAQRDRDPRADRAPQPGAMTQEQAYQVLGLQRGASAEEIRAAHRSLMKSAHPDQGGSAERAARLNAARDRLLDRHR